MASEFRPRIDPSLGATLGRTIDLVQQVATDELRMLQLDSQEAISQLAIGTVLVGYAPRSRLATP
jgi:hypothetical protein